MTTCERVDNILRIRNMSRRQLAIQAGIPPSSLQSAMERNKGLSLDMLFPISDVLNVSVKYLSIGEEEWEPTPEKLEEMAEYAPDEEQIKRAGFSLHINVAIEKLNLLGLKKAKERVEELTEIPRYRRQKPPETATGAPAPQSEGADTTPPPEGTEETQKGGG